MEQPKITRPDDAATAELCEQLSQLAAAPDADQHWPVDRLRLCGNYGVYEWFMPEKWGGQAWDDAAIIRGYLRLSAACLTTTFVITQRTGACRRIAACDNEHLQDTLLPPLVRGDTFATVGISHLTTSRQHLKQPALRAVETSEGYLLDGYSPWVTGALHAQTIVTGATMDDGRQILVALPTDLPGVSLPTPARLVGLTGSCTGAVRFDKTHVTYDLLIAGPVEDVMGGGTGANTGGLQTSTLAIGLATAAIAYVEEQSAARPELARAAEGLREEQQHAERDLLALAEGNEACSQADLRARANSLALRASQAALTAAKGAGYVAGHPAGRWCREALFFLVWSCPQPVVDANLCELAQLDA
ncbi:MAG: acyl-CoA/acyl-ACP dehydrogenase [Pirellulales bacterium]|nr:acyl-CoA/acyl-ACP dehydrogenase [Pirellulales bacterium]